MRADAERMLRGVLPEVGTIDLGPIVAGYQNDRFRVGTDHGDLFVKVSRVQRPVGIIATQQRINDHLVEHGFPAPRSIFIGQLDQDDDADPDTARTVALLLDVWVSFGLGEWVGGRRG